MNKGLQCYLVAIAFGVGALTCFFSHYYFAAITWGGASVYFTYRGCYGYSDLSE
jgi:hypothetical protein